jgi:predicted DCC family thiol-disulfide oxidoreductase YuxK
MRDHLQILNTALKKPVLIFDGDCGICRYWVNYWQTLTGDSVDYQPYQEAAGNYPDISVDEFRRSIQFITAAGEVCSGAQAVYVLLKGHFPYSFYLLLYRYLPGFAFLAEWAYTFFSRHRGLLGFISHVLWGRKLEAPKYELTSWLFLRLLGFIYLSAFASLAVQIKGLVGEDGILPLGLYLGRAQEHFGDAAFYHLPNLFWISHADLFLVGSCIAGTVFSLFLIFNVFARSSLVILFVLWLSLFHAGQTFMQFQWDLLLIECGFLALFLSTRSTLIVWLYRWLAFRFMFLGGVVKIASADPTWDNLTALTYHFETQPLPTALAWYAHNMPETVLMFMTAATLFIELLLPFFIFLTRNFRLLAAFGFIALQTAIILTGNYNYFNLLTLTFCLFLLDDTALRRLFPERLKVPVAVRKTLPADRIGFSIALLLSGIVISASSSQLWRIFTRSELPVLISVEKMISPLNIVNSYGPFAVMTTKRHEIIIEGSEDGENWRQYVFKYNPGDLHKRPQWIIPHQPRLDWQMWFAALSTPERQPWFRNLLIRLLQGSPPVLALFEHNPFPDQPPGYIRALLYEYRFSSPNQRKQTGQWWERKFAGIYHPAVSFSGQN